MKTDRRTFLHASLATAALAAGARAAASSDRVGIGLIGCGGISTADTNAFLAQPECEIVAICDVDDAQIEKTRQRLEKVGKKRPESVKDFRRILEHRDVDVCLVCTPDHWHALPTIAALQAGKDVYVEKPLAPTIGEGRAMRDAARRHGRICQMGTQWRSGEHYREAVELVRGGKIGKVRQVRCWAYLDWIRDIGNPPDGPVPVGVDYEMWLGPAPARPFNPNRFHFNFRWFWDYAGGLTTDWGVRIVLRHHLSACREGCDANCRKGNLEEHQSSGDKSARTEEALRRRVEPSPAFSCRRQVRTPHPSSRVPD